MGIKRREVSWLETRLRKTEKVPVNSSTPTILPQQIHISLTTWHQQRSIIFTIEPPNKKRIPCYVYISFTSHAITYVLLTLKKERGKTTLISSQHSLPNSHFSSDPTNFAYRERYLLSAEAWLLLSNRKSTLRSSLRVSSESLKKRSSCNSMIFSRIDLGWQWVCSLVTCIDLSGSTNYEFR